MPRNKLSPLDIKVREDISTNLKKAHKKSPSPAKARGINHLVVKCLAWIDQVGVSNAILSL